MRSPDLAGRDDSIRAWRFTVPPGVGPKDWQAGLCSWLIEADERVLDPLGIFSRWFVGVVTLADVPGVRPAVRQYPEAAYELTCFTVDPESGVDAEFYEQRVTTGDTSGPGAILVTPPDIVYQWHGTTDEQALEVAEAFVRAVVKGGWSPSRPPVGVSGEWSFPAQPAAVFDAEWRARLDATVQHYTSGHWPTSDAHD